MRSKNKALESHVVGYAEAIADNPMHRFRSWELVHRYFGRSKNFDVETGCMYLCSYLASWGMYRGSGFLLNRSSNVHKDVVREVRRKMYRSLRIINVASIERNSESLELLIELNKKIKSLYNLQSDNKHATDTLGSKVLLGVFGCAPAFDRYFRKGCKETGIAPYTFLSKNAYLSLVNLYVENQQLIDKLSKDLFASRKIRYPVMKVIDMYLWSVGSRRAYVKD